MSILLAIGVSLGGARHDVGLAFMNLGPWRGWVQRNARRASSWEDRHTPRATGRAKVSRGLAAKRGVFAVSDRQHGAFDP
jgi:hypothetical protein